MQPFIGNLNLSMGVFAFISFWGQITIVLLSIILKLELCTKELDILGRNISKVFQFQGMEIKLQGYAWNYDFEKYMCDGNMGMHVRTHIWHWSKI